MDIWYLFMHLEVIYSYIIIHVIFINIKNKIINTRWISLQPITTPVGYFTTNFGKAPCLAYTTSILRIFWDCFGFRLASWSRTASRQLATMTTIILGSQWGEFFFIIVGPASLSDMRSMWLGRKIGFSWASTDKELWNLITISETDLTLVQETKGYVCAQARLSIQFS